MSPTIALADVSRAAVRLALSRIVLSTKSPDCYRTAIAAGRIGSIIGPIDPGKVAALRHHVAGRSNRAAALMAQHDNQRCAEYGRAILHGADHGSVDQVAGIARHEQLADAEPAEQQLGRHAAVGAADDRGPGRLMLGQFAALLGEVEHAHLGLRHVTLVAVLQGVERLVWRQRGLGTTGGNGGANSDCGRGRDAQSGQSQYIAAIDGAVVTRLAHWKALLLSPTGSIATRSEFSVHDKISCRFN